jgi:hypothetical protein
MKIVLNSAAFQGLATLALALLSVLAEWW